MKEDRSTTSEHAFGGSHEEVPGNLLCKTEKVWHVGGDNHTEFVDLFCVCDDQCHSRTNNNQNENSTNYQLLGGMILARIIQAATASKALD